MAMVACWLLPPGMPWCNTATAGIGRRQKGIPAPNHRPHTQDNPKSTLTSPPRQGGGTSCDATTTYEKGLGSVLLKERNPSSTAQRSDIQGSNGGNMGFKHHTTAHPQDSPETPSGAASHNAQWMGNQ